jgi:hypothetical protein
VSLNEPAGKTYCIKVQFSAQMRCPALATPDTCAVRLA